MKFKFIIRRALLCALWENDEVFPQIYTIHFRDIKLQRFSLLLQEASLFSRSEESEWVQFFMQQAKLSFHPIAAIINFPSVHILLVSATLSALCSRLNAKSFTVSFLSPFCPHSPSVKFYTPHLLCLKVFCARFSLTALSNTNLFMSKSTFL